MATAALKRLAAEDKAMKTAPPEFITARPDPKHPLLWHYCLTGPPGTPYEGGLYLGTVAFPPSYPFAPPAIRMTTASGRFEPNKRLCLSLSDFHPETWNPIWTVHTILVGLLSFMVTNDPTHGSIQTSDDEKRELAVKSREQLTSTTAKVFPVLTDNGVVALAFR